MKNSHRVCYCRSLLSCCSVYSAAHSRLAELLCSVLSGCVNGSEDGRAENGEESGEAAAAVAITSVLTGLPAVWQWVLLKSISKAFVQEIGSAPRGTVCILKSKYYGKEKAQPLPSLTLPGHWCPYVLCGGGGLVCLGRVFSWIRSLSVALNILMTSQYFFYGLRSCCPEYLTVPQQIFPACSFGNDRV